MFFWVFVCVGGGDAVVGLHSDKKEDSGLIALHGYLQHDVVEHRREVVGGEGREGLQWVCVCG